MAHNRYTRPRLWSVLSPPTEGGEIILENQEAVKATPKKRKGVDKDQDYCDIGYQSLTTKHVAVRWNPGHRDLTRR